MPSPPCATWKFPPVPPGDVSLRALMAEDGRLEHHLVVVARAGDAVLECATASEPLAFAHANISDEYAVMLPTGDPLLDSFQARTFITDETGHDVGRFRHGVGDLVLHPHGYLHWPGRLRPPYAPMTFAPGMRRRGLSLVACAAHPTPPASRPLGVTPGREADVKSEAPDVPLLLTDLRRAAPGLVGVIADARLELVVDARPAEPPHGGWLVDLDTCVLSRTMRHVARGLLFYSPTGEADAPPPIPEAPFALFEDAAPGTLPFTVGDLRFTGVADDRVDIRTRSGAIEVPRHWLARTLFRVALHGYRLGRVETYGGFFLDDTGPDLVLGIPGGAAVAPRYTLWPLYRAVAPPGYRERPAD